MLTITPIGTVRNEIRTPIVQGWGKVVSDLVLNERYTDGLDGIEDYSHVVVIFWMDQAGPPKSLKGHVQSRKICLLLVFLLDVDHPVPIPSVLQPYLFLVVRRTSYGCEE